MPSSISVHSDIVIEDWDNTWANPVDMVKQGFQIINANDLELYIVPHANYFHDFLDTQTLYTSWDPSVFSLHNPALNLQPDDPHLLGATFAVWNDKLGSKVSVSDITARLEPALPVLGEKMWNGSTQTLNYVQFEAVAQLVGQTPAIPWSKTT
jgi:hexosaminidase